jgi:hypothetical protein
MTTSRPSPSPMGHPPRSSVVPLVFAWLVVGIPLAWGVMQTLLKALVLFR